MLGAVSLARVLGTLPQGSLARPRALLRSALVACTPVHCSCLPLRGGSGTGSALPPSPALPCTVHAYPLGGALARGLRFPPKFTTRDVRIFDVSHKPTWHMTKKKSPEILRTAHGTGSAAILRAEQPPLDEIPSPNADDTAAGLALTKARGRPFEKKNTAAKGRRLALTELAEVLPGNDPRYEKAVRQARTYRRHRISELAVQNSGYLSAGASAMIAQSAALLAMSKYLSDIAVEHFARGQFKEGADFSKKALDHAKESRQQELTAIGLAEREGKAAKEARELLGPDGRRDPHDEFDWSIYASNRSKNDD